MMTYLRTRAITGAAAGAAAGAASSARAWAWARRAAALVLLPGLSLLALSGCAKMNAALSKQTAVVSFSSSTTVATELKVRTACSGIPNVRPTALPTHRTALNMLNAVQYDITHASDANIAELDTCLTKYKSVQGINFQNVADDGS